MQQSKPMLSNWQNLFPVQQTDVFLEYLTLSRNATHDK